MLHNSGPYGPNEVPGNMIAPINNNQIGPIDTPHNLSNISNFGGDNSRTSNPQYILTDYPAFGQHSSSLNAQTNPYLSSYSNNVHRITYPIQTQNSYTNSDETNLGSCTLDPRNFPNYYNTFHNNNKALASQTSLNSEFKHTRDVPLNIPQVHINSFRETSNNVANSANSPVVKSEGLMNENINIRSDIFLDSKDINSRTERLGKAIKHIENVIASDILHRNKSVEHKTEPKLQEIEFLNTGTYNSEESIEVEIKQEYNSEDSGDESTETKETPFKITTKSETVTSSSEVSYENYFARDMNQVTKDNVQNRIVSGEKSIAEATNCIKEGVRTSDYFECPHCEILFSHPKRFLVHAKWHNFGLTNLKQQELAEARNLRRALKSGEALAAAGGADTYPCKDCDKVFTRPNALKGHRHRKHKIADRLCRICNVMVGDWQAYRVHIATVHAADTLQCAYCSKSFKYKHTLQKHEQTHQEKTVSCPSCPKLFGSEQLLRAHQKTHELKERGPSRHCSYCGKGFYHTYNLQMHERTHTDEKPYECKSCNSRFYTNSSMKRHMRVSHSASKPYVCTTCHRSFVSADIRQRHALRAHSDQSKFKHQCTLCPSKYLTSKALRTHTYKCHPKVTHHSGSE